MIRHDEATWSDMKRHEATWSDTTWLNHVEPMPMQHASSVKCHGAQISRSAVGTGQAAAGGTRCIVREHRNQDWQDEMLHEGKTVAIQSCEYLSLTTKQSIQWKAETAGLIMLGQAWQDTWAFWEPFGPMAATPSLSWNALKGNPFWTSFNNVRHCRSYQPQTKREWGERESLELHWNHLKHVIIAETMLIHQFEVYLNSVRRSCKAGPKTRDPREFHPLQNYVAICTCHLSV